MAASNKKFNLTELLNQRSKEASQQGQQGAAEAEKDTAASTMADIYDLIPSKDNFYSVEDVQDLKQSIELLGILQPLLVADEEDGKRRIIAGHRRRLAIMQLVDEGKERFRYVPIMERPTKNAILDRLALIMTNRFREKTDWEKMTESIETEKLVQELKAQMDIPGRTRDLLAEIIDASPATLGRYKAIYNNLAAELMAEFKAGKIGVSVIYEISQLEKEWQLRTLEVFRGKGTLALPDIKEMKRKQEAAGQMNFDGMEAGQQDTPEASQTGETAEEGGNTGEDEDTVSEGAGEQQEDFMNKPEEYEEPQPETVDSLCYSCNNYENCHEKKRTVTSCNAYINRTEAQKTDEQRYSEEQDKIDRETKKRLREMADEERMDNIPGKGQTGKKYLRAAGSLFERIMNGEQNFMILKNEGYKKGEKITVGEFSDGKETGRTLEIIISHMEDDKTSSAIGDGYCVINAIMSPALNSLERKKQEPHEEPEKMQEQPPLPVLKNNEQRKEWLRKYQEWGLWYKDGNIGAKYYRYCFENGAELIVEEYQDHSEYAGDYTSSYFHLIGGPEAPRKSHGLCGWQRHDKYKKFPNSETELVEFLKFVQKGDK